jgi:hypothetical protein
MRACLHRASVWDGAEQGRVRCSHAQQGWSPAAEVVARLSSAPWAPATSALNRYSAALAERSSVLVFKAHFAPARGHGCWQLALPGDCFDRSVDGVYLRPGRSTGDGPAAVASFLNGGQNTSLVLCMRAYETGHRALLEMPDPGFRHHCHLIDFFLQPSPRVERRRPGPGSAVDRSAAGR